MKPEVEMYFTNPIDLSKKYYTQLSQVKHSQTDNGIKYIIFPSFTNPDKRLLKTVNFFYFLFHLSICIMLPIWTKPKKKGTILWFQHEKAMYW